MVRGQADNRVDNLAVEFPAFMAMAKIIAEYLELLTDEKWTLLKDKLFMRNPGSPMETTTKVWQKKRIQKLTLFLAFYSQKNRK